MQVSRAVPRNFRLKPDLRRSARTRGIFGREMPRLTASREGMRHHNGGIQSRATWVAACRNAPIRILTIKSVRPTTHGRPRFTAGRISHSSDSGAPTPSIAQAEVPPRRNGHPGIRCARRQGDRGQDPGPDGQHTPHRIANDVASGGCQRHRGCVVPGKATTAAYCLKEYKFEKLDHF